MTLPQGGNIALSTPTRFLRTKQAQIEEDRKYPKRPADSTQKLPGKKTIICYICGREFGSKSIGIHEPQCLKKWQQQNQQLPAELRRPAPVKPQVYHNANPGMSGVSQETGHPPASGHLVPCLMCGRNFAMDRVEKHMEVCKKLMEKGVAPPPRSKMLSTTSQRPEDARLDVDGDENLATGNSDHPACAAMPSPAATTGELMPCDNCGRNFATDRLEQHRQICLKIAAKPRKTFNTLKQRLTGTEHGEMALRAAAEGRLQAGTENKPQSNWRENHKQLQESMKAGRAAAKHLASGGKISELPPPPPMVNPDYVQCPNCERRFNEKAAERHIPQCSRIGGKPSPHKAKTETPRKVGKHGRGTGGMRF